MLRDKKIEYEEVKELAKQVAPLMAMENELFDEVVGLNAILKKIPDDVFHQDKPEAKWMKIFKETNLYHLFTSWLALSFPFRSVIHL